MQYNRSVTKVPTEGLKRFFNCKKPLKETISICSHSYIFPNSIQTTNYRRLLSVKIHRIFIFICISYI